MYCNCIVIVLYCIVIVLYCNCIVLYCNCIVLMNVCIYILCIRVCMYVYLPSESAPCCKTCEISGSPSSMIAFIIWPAPLTNAIDGCWNNLNKDRPANCFIHVYVCICMYFESCLCLSCVMYYLQYVCTLCMCNVVCMYMYYLCICIIYV